MIENTDESKAGSSGLSKDQYNCGDYVLVKFTGNKTEYRYAGIDNKIDKEEGEITITYEIGE